MRQTAICRPLPTSLHHLPCELTAGGHGVLPLGLLFHPADLPRHLHALALTALSLALTALSLALAALPLATLAQASQAQASQALATRALTTQALAAFQLL